MGRGSRCERCPDCFEMLVSIGMQAVIQVKGGVEVKQHIVNIDNNTH